MENSAVWQWLVVTLLVGGAAWFVVRAAVTRLQQLTGIGTAPSSTSRSAGCSGCRGCASAAEPVVSLAPPRQRSEP